MRVLGWFLIGWGSLNAVAFGFGLVYRLYRHANPPPTGSFELEILAQAGVTFYVVGLLVGTGLVVFGWRLRRVGRPAAC